MKLFDPDTPIMEALHRASMMIWINALWLICCLPVVTAGAATTAMYRMLFTMRAGGAVGAKAYFRALAADWKPATILWLVVPAGGAVLYAAYRGILLIGPEAVRLVLLVPFCAAFLLLCFWTLYVFPLTAYFDNTAAATARNALAMSLRHPRSTIPAMAVCLLPALVLLFFPYWFLRLLYVWLLFAPVLCAYAAVRILTPVFEAYAEDGKTE